MNEPLTKAQREAILETKQPRAYIRENIARYEATVQDLEARLAGEKQGHRIMDAAYWAQTAALGVLAGFVEACADERIAICRDGPHSYWCVFCGHFSQAFPYISRIRHSETCLHVKARIALAPDFVQQAAEAWKAKEAEIERLKEQRFGYHENAHRYWKQRNEAEAKLAVATGLLKRALQPPYLAGPINDPTAAEIAVFLADPSQAAVQYREALTTVTAEARSDSLPLLDGTVQEEEQQP